MLASVVGEASPEFLAAIDRPGREAAVLLGLIERPRGLQLLLTQRAAHLTHHAGQISFPGGRLAEAGEAAVAAALREAREEVSLEPGQVSVAGCLDLHWTGTGFSVTPVVGFISGGFEARPDPAEVSDVFEVPLEFILDPANVRSGIRERFGSRFRTYEFNYLEHRIWGATAAILMTFRDLITK